MIFSNVLLIKELDKDLTMIRTWAQYQQRIQDHVENNHSTDEYDDLSCQQCSPAKEDIPKNYDNFLTWLENKTDAKSHTFQTLINFRLAEKAQNTTDLRKWLFQVLISLRYKDTQNFEDLLNKLHKAWNEYDGFNDYVTISLNDEINQNQEEDEDPQEESSKNKMKIMKEFLLMKMKVNVHMKEEKKKKKKQMLIS